MQGEGEGGRQAGEQAPAEGRPRADRPRGPATVVTGTLTALTQQLDLGVTGVDLFDPPANSMRSVPLVPPFVWVAERRCREIE